MPEPGAPAVPFQGSMATRPLGRFHELSLPTPDIRASVEFYERLGFRQAQTGDAWSHPYGVLTDGRIALGLHQDPAREVALTYVQPGVARYGAELERQGCALAYRRTGMEEFHEIGFRDPSGQLITILEARTYSPLALDAGATSQCGSFAAVALPSSDLDVGRRFWEPLGFVALGERDEPFRHLALTSDHLDLLLHGVRSLRGPTLVFAEPDMAERIASLRAAGLIDSTRSRETGRAAAHQALGAAPSALLESPEGTQLLLLAAEI